jgi:predicted ATPase
VIFQLRQRYTFKYFLFLLFIPNFITKSLQKLNSQKVVITGAPGTGKTSIINELLKRNHICFEEISRAVTIEAQKRGIDQLFLKDPLLFSNMLLEGRKQQYLDSNKATGPFVFLDRGLPDVLAYMDYYKTKYPKQYKSVCKNYTYNYVVILNPWQEIYKSDNERYENFDQAREIHHHIVNTYSSYGYDLLEVPFDTVEQRTNYILNALKQF